MPTNVPQPELTATGFAAPSESAIRDGEFADINKAFGGNLNPDETTPQGQLADALTAQIGANNDLFLYMVNQVDPSYASGRMQDAIARLYYLTRQGPLPTVVLATLVGRPGTIIPAGSLAIAADETVYQSLGAVTIPASGTINTEFAATVDGPVAAPAGTLGTILRAVAGWDTINNASDGTLGRNTETRAEFEARRTASVALNAIGILPAIRASVLAAPDVLDAYVTENPSGSPMTIGGVTLPAHSLYVAVTGGTDADVARAIWFKKPPGCDYYGNTTVTVLDRNGYSAPYPSYAVTFQRPSALPIFVNVELSNSSIVPSDATIQIKAAIIAAFNGQFRDLPRARIGSKLLASRFYAPVGELGAWAAVDSIQIGLAAPGLLDSVSARIDQQPTISAANITVTLV